MEPYRRFRSKEERIRKLAIIPLPVGNAASGQSWRLLTGEHDSSARSLAEPRGAGCEAYLIEFLYGAGKLTLVSIFTRVGFVPTYTDSQATGHIQGWLLCTRLELGLDWQ